MDYYLLNTSLEIVNILETYKSVIWTTRYYTSGDFELYIPATQDMINLIKKDYYIVRSDDLTQAMIVENIQITTDVEAGDYIIITGKSLKSILSRRIIWNQTILSGRVEKCVRQLVNENAIASSITARNIPNLILGSELGITDTISVQFTGTNLEEAIVEICKSYHLGYDILLDWDTKKFVFILYKGTDRSYDQSENPYVVFSNEYENLLTSNYQATTGDYKNVAKIAGEGEGVDRRTATIGTATGLNRYELFVDARDISSNDGAVTDSDYTNLLVEKGNTSLAEHTLTEAIEGEVAANYTYKINEDYFLGDVVSVVNEYGIAMTPRIIEVIESEDDTGKYIIPTFSTDES